WNDTPDDDGPDDGQPDPELDALDDNALAAREAAIELDARKLLAGGGAPDAARLDKLRHMRRRLRRARRRLRMQGGGRGAGRFGRHAR
ncbi:MAG: hypothetical protein ABMB14_24595, partial [Myxococcota bacterium]